MFFTYGAGARVRTRAYRTGVYDELNQIKNTCSKTWFFLFFILFYAGQKLAQDLISYPYIRITDKKLSDKCKTCVSLWLFTVVAAQARKLQLCMMSKMTWNIHKPSTVIFFLLKVRVTKPAHCKNCYLNSYYPVAILPPYPESCLLALAVFGNLWLRSAPPAASLAVG